MPSVPLFHRWPGLSAVLACLMLPACATNPLAGLQALVDPADSARRAAIELAVKDRHDRLLTDLASGGGPDLAAALEAAGIPPSDRPARILQLQGDYDLYATSPSALINALVLYGA